MLAPRRFITHAPAETAALAAALGARLRAGDVVCLSGEMGTGKTVFAQGLAAGLEVTEPVSSPTFALVHAYSGRVPVWHLDTYRVESTDELIDLGWDDLLTGGGVVIVEWPERIAPGLPPDRLDVLLEYGAGDTRALTLAARGPRSAALLAAAHAQRAPGYSAPERPARLKGERDARPGD